MNNDISVSLKNINKTFYIAEDKKDSLRSLVISMFNQGKSKKFHALENINIEIKKGEFLGIIGRNGSGKSTLLKIIAGIYSPDKGGEIKINGKMVPFLELGVGFNPELTGKENIFLNGTILGLTRKQIEKRYDRIVEFSELGEFIHSPVKNYSSGMKVRLAFSIAIQTDADIYILDEILGVGDGAFRTKSIGVIQKLIEQGKTVIYVSHSLGSVQKYCDRVVWLNNGRLVFEGDTLKGIDQYRQSLLEIEKAQKIVEEQYDKKDNKIELKKIFVNTLGNGKLTIRARFNLNEPVSSYNVRFSISKDDESLIYMTSSDMSGVKISGEYNAVALELEEMNLLEGDYYVDVRVTGEDEKDVLYEEKRAAVFHTLPEERYITSEGLVHFNSSWSIDKI